MMDLLLEFVYLFKSSAQFVESMKPEEKIARGVHSEYISARFPKERLSLQVYD